MKPLIAIPATAALVYRAYSRKSLTPLGIVAAAISAIIHAAHPSPAPFAFLVVFFLGGTAVTKVKADVKARLTTSSMGGGAEGPRTHVQVLANSAVASILVLLHLWREWMGDGNAECLAYGGAKDGLLLVGITANYAVVAADTYSSELGILSKSSPRLVTSPTLRKVPKGTNGGVTITGLFAGVLGAFTIALTSLILLPCSAGAEVWTGKRRLAWVLAVTLWGALGSVVDSILGGLLQATVVDKRTGKVVEGIGGSKVLVHPGSVCSVGPKVSIRGESHIHATEDVANAITPRASRTEYDPLASEPGDKGEHGDNQSRKVDVGNDLLDNNQINLLMAALMSIGGMGAAGYVWNNITF